MLIGSFDLCASFHAKEFALKNKIAHESVSTFSKRSSPPLAISNWDGCVLWLLSSFVFRHNRTIITICHITHYVCHQSLFWPNAQIKAKHAKSKRVFPETIHLNKWLNGNWSCRSIARIVNVVSYNRGTKKLKSDFAFLTVFAANRWHCVNFSHCMLKNIFHDKSPIVSKPFGKHFVKGQLPYFKKRTI